MKTQYMEEMVGKTISSVILRARDVGYPQCQLFISFEEGRFFEFFCTSEMIFPAKGSFMGDAFEMPLREGDGEDLARFGHIAQGGKENQNHDLKVELALKKANEIRRCFNNYDDTSVAAGLKELIGFLEGSLKDLSFKEEFHTYRDKSGYSDLLE